MSPIRIATGVLFVVAALSAQTTNVYGTNELTINGYGYSQASCIPLIFPVNNGLSTNWNGLANSPIVLAIDGACGVNTVVLGPNNTLDLPFSAAFLIALDGTGGAAPSWLTPFLHTDGSGYFNFAIPYAPLTNGFNFALQGAFFNPAYPLGFQLSAAFTISGPTPPTPPNLGQAGSTTANPNAVNTGLACDDCNQVMNLGFTYQFYGQSYTQVFVGSNGYVTFGSGDTTYFETPSWLASGPARIAPLFDDQETSSGGSILFYADPTNQYFEVTWNQVQEYYANGPNTYKLSAFPGYINFDFNVNITTNDCIVGLSPGNNLGAATAINVAAGGNLIAPLTAPYEQWDGNLSIFNLKGYQVVWALDALGNPIYQN